MCSQLMPTSISIGFMKESFTVELKKLGVPDKAVTSRLWNSGMEQEHTLDSYICEAPALKKPNLVFFLLHLCN
jgi:hypothetical protein